MKKRNILILASIGLTASLLLTACGQQVQEEPVAETLAVVETLPTEAEEESEADTIGVEETEVASSEEENVVLDSIRVYGQVKEISENKIYIENDMQNSMIGSVRLNITEQTLILDAVNAEVRTIEDIEDGETLYAYVSPAMTRSLPPMSNAELIFCDIPIDFAAPEYAEIVKVSTGEERTSLETNRDIIYHIGEEIEIIDFTTGEKTDVSSIKEGSKVIAWYQIVMESLPAQTYPYKIIVF